MTQTDKMPGTKFDPAHFFLLILVYLGVAVIAMLLIEGVIMAVS